MNDFQITPERSPLSEPSGSGNIPAFQLAPPLSRVSVKLPGVTPVVVYVLMGMTILVFLLQMASQYLMSGADILAGLGMKSNLLIVKGQFWRFITPVFLHGSLLHIGFNMYALSALGPRLERHYGHWRFLGLYLLAGFAGNVASFIFSPNPSLGSSTAIFGVLGAEGVFIYQNRKLFGRVSQRALGNILTVAVVNLLIGLTPGIDNWGHVGGLIGGTFFAWLAGPVLRVEGIFPNLNVVDERGPGEVVRAGLSVALVFALAAAAAIFVRR